MVKVLYFYGNIPVSSRVFDDSDRALQRTILDYVKTFAANGDPNGPDLPLWTDDPDGAAILELGETVGMMPEKYLALYAILDKMTGWS